jgi:hypothetical protein
MYHKGWKELTEFLHKDRERLINELISSDDMEKVRVLQVEIRSIDRFLNLPQRLIKRRA